MAKIRCNTQWSQTYSMQAHIPTLILVILVMSATMTASMVAAGWRSNRDGLRQAAWGLGLHVLVYVLFSLRGQISDLISVWLANVLLASAMALFSSAVYQFHGRKFPLWLAVLPIMTMAIAYAVYLHDTRLRILFGALSLSFLSVATLAELWRQRRDTAGIGQYFLIVAFSIFAVLFLQRFFATWLVEGIDLNLTAQGNLQTLTSLASIVCLSLVTMGLLLMGKERSDERNRRLAMADELTGLPNRRHVLDVLNQQLASATRSGMPLAVLMLDIDYFKRINDTLGHPAGDETLRQVSACLKDRIRGQDIAGRVGGEEFLVILPQTTATGAAQLAETLRAAVEALLITSDDGKVIPVTISIGVCAGEVSQALRSEQFIALADAALYRAKTGGRNRVETASVSEPTALETNE